MDRETAQAWVDELGSGKYPKGRLALYADGGFCCLGVLAAMNGHLENVPQTGRKIFNDGVAEIDGNWHYVDSGRTATGYLPDGYAGLQREDQTLLASINDAASSFKPVVREIRDRWLS